MDVCGLRAGVGDLLVCKVESGDAAIHLKRFSQRLARRPTLRHSALHGFQCPSVPTNVPGLDSIIPKSLVPTKQTNLGHGAAALQFKCQVLSPFTDPISEDGRP